MIAVELTQEFRAAFPAGVFGALAVRDCPNRPQATVIRGHLQTVVVRLRERYLGETIDADLVAAAYAAYFRRHGARYPVVHQARGLLAGRTVSSPSALVEVMVTAEVDSLILTSGHDPETLQGPLEVDAARDGETYVKLSGKEQSLRRGDMVVRDREGIIACVLYGPDFRTRLRPESQAAFFGAWCPAGVSPAAVEAHLRALADLIRGEWPKAAVDSPRIWTPAPG